MQKKLIEKDTPDPGEKVGIAADGQMGFCLIHAIIKFYLENVFAYFFLQIIFIIKNDNVKRGNLNGEQLGSSCNSTEKR